MPILVDQHFNTANGLAWPDWTHPNTYGSAAARTTGGKGELILPAGLTTAYQAAVTALHPGNGFGGAGIVDIEFTIPATDADVSIEHSFFTGDVLRRDDYFFNVRPQSPAGDNRFVFGTRDAAGASTVLLTVSGIEWRGKTIRARLRKSDASASPNIKFKAWDKAGAEPGWQYDGVPSTTLPSANLVKFRFGLHHLEDPLPASYTVGWEYLTLATIAADTLPYYVVRADGSLKGPLDTYYVKQDGSLG